MDTLKAKGLTTNDMEHRVLICRNVIKAENEEPWCEMSEREQTPVIVTKKKYTVAFLISFTIVAKLSLENRTYYTHSIGSAV